MIGERQFLQMPFSVSDGKMPFQNDEMRPKTQAPEFLFGYIIIRNVTQSVPPGFLGIEEIESSMADEQGIFRWRNISNIRSHLE